MDSFLVYLVLFGLAAAYTTYVLLFDLEIKESHFGPFPSSSSRVYFDDHDRPVVLFDRVRRLFGVYRVDGDRWFINEGAVLDRWTCPYCLSFWVSVVLAFVMVLFTHTWLLYPIVVLALSEISSAINVKVHDV